MQTAPYDEESMADEDGAPFKECANAGFDK